MHRRIVILALIALAAMLISPRPAAAYVEAPFSPGRIIAESTNIVLVRVESVDKEKNLIVYRKVKDIKGTHPTDIIKHNIGRGGFNPREWQFTMAWAEVGQTALFFHNGGAGETCINNYWYQTYAGGEWWNFSHGEPYLLRSFCGKPEKLLSSVQSMIAGQEVVLPCMVDGDKMTLQLRTARLQRLKASTKLQDYNPVRDFAGWGVEEFRPIADMPGFTHQTALNKVSPGCPGIAMADFDGDGKMDFLLYGGSRCVLLQNTGGSLNETPLPVEGPVRAADWADFNGDGRPDLLLATPAGLRLLLNTPKGFIDATAALPQPPCPFITAAAWIHTNGAGPTSRPDILVADGFRGLRLYHNKTADPEFTAAMASMAKFGKWYYAGPFPNDNNTGFDRVYPPENQPFDLKKEYAGKGGEKVVWREGNFQDGQVNNLRLFKDGGPDLNENAVVYLYRQIDSTQRVDLPVSLGSDDTITVWLNGRKLLAENVYRGCEPDQNQAVLPLQAGKNALLIKICQGGGDWAFYFQPKSALGQTVVANMFEDVSDKVGLGEHGIAATLKGDRLIVANVKGDARPDFLFSAGTGVLVLNTPQGFVEAKDCGISYQAGQVTPVFGDFYSDKTPGLFVPQDGVCKLFRGDGKGRFVDVTARAGDLAKPIAHATCGAWVDFANPLAVSQGNGENASKQPSPAKTQAGNPTFADLFVGCLNGPNRYYRNNGNGTFTDATEQIGLDRRIFNTRAIGMADINKDGLADVVFVNEGQESAALLTSPNRPTGRAANAATPAAEHGRQASQ